MRFISVFSLLKDQYTYIMKRAEKYHEQKRLKRAAFWIVIKLKCRLHIITGLKTIEGRDLRRIRNGVVFKAKSCQVVMKNRAAKIVVDFVKFTCSPSNCAEKMYTFMMQVLFI
jgi:hypothetical protein